MRFSKSITNPNNKDIKIQIFEQKVYKAITFLINKTNEETPKNHNTRFTTSFHKLFIEEEKLF